MAPIMALQEIDKNNEIEIYTDSQYVRLGITEWIHKWIKNNWQTSKKEPVKNKELWMQLYELTKSYKIKWIWVKAHAGNALNEEVDNLDARGHLRVECVDALCMCACVRVRACACVCVRVHACATTQ